MDRAYLECHVHVVIGGVRHVSVTAAGRMVGLSRQAVWEAVRRGRVRAIRSGRFWLLPVRAVLAWRRSVERSRKGKAK